MRTIRKYRVARHSADSGLIYTSATTERYTPSGQPVASLGALRDDYYHDRHGVENMITPTQHERDEWARMAQDAYRTGRNFYGHRYSVAAAIYTGPMNAQAFDTLQDVYRTWLVFGWGGTHGVQS